MIVNFCIADANTFLYAKCTLTIKQDSEKIPIGGGNFTVLLSTLAVLEFLGTVDAIIDSNNDNFYSENEISKLEQLKKETLKKYADNFLQEYLNKVFGSFPKNGQIKIVSGKLLRNFLEKTNKITGVNKSEAGKLQSIRNKLAHEFTPKIISAAAIGPIPGADFINLILQYKNRDVFCLTKENTIGIDSNALNHKLNVLLKYILEKLEDCSKDRIEKISNYIEKTK